MQPRVTVVIPCYNHGRYVDEAVQSALSQTYQDVEIVIVNDGSTDPFTVELLRGYSKPRTRVLETVNRGLSAARNAGVADCESEYILLLDADDKFRPTFVEKAVAILDAKPEVGMVGCWVQTFGDYSYTIKCPGGGATDSLLKSGCSACTLLRRTCWESVGGYDETLTMWEDWDFYLSITQKGWRVEVIPEVLFDCRKRRGSMSDKGNHDLARTKSIVIEKHVDLFREHVVEALFCYNSELERTERVLESVYASPTYKIGGMVTLPFRVVRAAVRKLAGVRSKGD